jgi:Fe-S cluster biosynthesis and repair protein YggX
MKNINTNATNQFLNWSFKTEQKHTAKQWKRLDLFLADESKLKSSNLTENAFLLEEITKYHYGNT